MNRSFIIIILITFVSSLSFAFNPQDLSIKIADYKMNKRCAVCYSLDKDKMIIEELDIKDYTSDAVSGIKPVTYSYSTNDLHRYTSDSLNQSFCIWVDGLIDKKEWGVALSHNKICDFDSIYSNIGFKNHFDYISVNEKEIWIATYKEVSTYITQRENIRLCVTYNKKSIIVNPIVNLDPKFYGGNLTLIIDNCSANLKIKQNKKKIHLIKDNNQLIFEINPYGGAIEICY